MGTFILVTNLAGVVIETRGGPLRVAAHALTIEDHGAVTREQVRDGVSPGSRFVLRGFGTDSSTLLFTMPLQGIGYQFTRDDVGDRVAHAFGARVVTAHGELRLVHPDCPYHNDPELVGCGCVSVKLDSCSTDGRAIDFETFEGDWADDRLRETIWRRLHAKVASYWEAPFMPVASSVRVELARKATAGDLR